MDGNRAVDDKNEEIDDRKAAPFSDATVPFSKVKGILRFATRLKEPRRVAVQESARGVWASVSSCAGKPLCAVRTLHGAFQGSCLPCFLSLRLCDPDVEASENNVQGFTDRALVHC